MKKTGLIGIMIVMSFVFSLVPFASAQYVGIGGGGNITVEEQLKLAKEKIGLVYDTHSTGVPCNIWNCPRTMFFYPSIILIGIISSIVIFVLFIKSRRSSNKKEVR